MKTLITGGGGQVAAALVASAPQDCRLWAPPRAELDICEVAAVKDAIGRFEPDVIINTAAYTAVDRAESEAAIAVRVNADAVGTLARSAADHGARLVHISTDFVFDGSANMPYRTDAAAAPINVYGRSKLAGEQAALAIPDSLVVRTAWVYGATGANFVKTMLRLMRREAEIRVVNDQIGTPTHAASLARTLWQLARRNAAGVLHATDAGVASWYDFAVAIAEEACAMGLIHRPVSVLPIMTADYPTPARRPQFSVLDKSATWQLLGARAAHWRVELREMLQTLGAFDRE